MRRLDLALVLTLTACTIPDAVPGEPDGAPSSTGTGGAGGSQQEGGAAGTGGDASSSRSAGGTGSGGADCAAAQVSARTDHTCAMSVEGRVWCWGKNESGEVGDGSTTSPQKNPREVDLGGSALAVAAGGRHSCALAAESVLCWGAADFGQIGDGSVDVAPLPSPTQVNLEGAIPVELALGADHGCARTQSNTLLCWGRNDDGQIGDGSMTTPQPLPVPVTALGAGVAQVSAGQAHTCAVLEDKSVWCWGRNSDGQLGVGLATIESATPLQVTALGNDVQSVAAGGYHTCAVKTDGTLWCWGKNTSGQLGTGDTVGPQPAPVKVTDFQNTVDAVFGGSLNTCARKTDGSLWCFGHNVYGQVGDGTSGIENSPKAKAVEVSALGMSVQQASTGYHTCAVRSGGDLFCWGNNEHGELGDGSTDAEPEPLEITLPCR